MLIDSSAFWSAAKALAISIIPGTTEKKREFSAANPRTIASAFSIQSFSGVTVTGSENVAVGWVNSIWHGVFVS